MLALELVHEVVNHAVVKVFLLQGGCFVVALTSKIPSSMVVRSETSKVPIAEVKDEHVALAFLLVEAVRDSGSRRFVNNAEHIEASDGTGVLGVRRCESLKYAEP